MTTVIDNIVMYISNPSVRRNTSRNEIDFNNIFNSDKSNSFIADIINRVDKEYLKPRRGLKLISSDTLNDTINKLIDSGWSTTEANKEVIKQIVLNKRQSDAFAGPSKRKAKSSSSDDKQKTKKLVPVTDPEYARIIIKNKFFNEVSSSKLSIRKYIDSNNLNPGNIKNLGFVYELLLYLIHANRLTDEQEKYYLLNPIFYYIDNSNSLRYQILNPNDESMDLFAKNPINQFLSKFKYNNDKNEGESYLEFFKEFIAKNIIYDSCKSKTTVDSSEKDEDGSQHRSQPQPKNDIDDKIEEELEISDEYKQNAFISQLRLKKSQRKRLCENIISNLLNFYRVSPLPFSVESAKFGRMRFTKPAGEGERQYITGKKKDHHITDVEVPICYICGNPILCNVMKNEYKLLDCQIDHVIPVIPAFILGVIQCPLNFLPAHSRCNTRKSDNLPNLSDFETQIQTGGIDSAKDYEMIKHKDTSYSRSFKFNKLIKYFTTERNIYKKILLKYTSYSYSEIKTIATVNHDICNDMITIFRILNINNISISNQKGGGDSPVQEALYKKLGEYLDKYGKIESYNNDYIAFFKFVSPTIVITKKEIIKDKKNYTIPQPRYPYRKGDFYDEDTLKKGKMLLNRYMILFNYSLNSYGADFEKEIIKKYEECVNVSGLSKLLILL